MKNHIFHLEAYVASYGGFQGFGPDLGEWLGAAHFSFFSGKKATSKIWVLLLMDFHDF